MMNFLGRALAVLLLLGSLAYGSYAVGRYVLSEKLFGDSVAAKSQSTLLPQDKPHVTKLKDPSRSAQSGVEVEVLPADEAGPGPDVNLSQLRPEKTGDSTAATPSRSRVVSPNTFRDVRSSRLRSRRDDTIGNYSSIDEDGRSNYVDGEEDRPRKRRRRRRRRTREATTEVVSSSERSTRSTRSSDDDSPGRSRSRSSSSDSNDNDRPRRRRSESRSESRSSDAPVRVQSDSSSGSSGGDSGGDSPIPQPE